MSALEPNVPGMLIGAGAPGHIAGRCQLFVACGSQLSVWSQFPSEIVVVARDATSGTEFTSVDLSMNVSYDQTTIDNYAALPCDQVVGRDFTIQMRAHIPSLPRGPLQLVARASFFGLTSNYLQLEVP